MRPQSRTAASQVRSRRADYPVVDASLIVPLQGGAEQALRCFASLALLPPDPEHEVVVVDDASTGLDDLLARLDGDVTVVRSERRSGFPAACALGAERASGDALVLLRGVPEVGEAWLAPLLAALSDPSIAAAASATQPAAARAPGTAVPPAAARAAAIPAAPPGAAAVIASSALALRRADAAALQAMLGAPEGLELAALCLELSARGRAVPVPASVVRPAGARSAGARRPLGEEPELTVVIPTLDAASERVRGCVAAVQATTDAAHEIVLVDNGAPPQGFTAPVNAGLRAARGRYAVVMNDDVETLPGWWPPLRDALEAGEQVAFPLTVDGAARRDFAAWCFALSREAIERFGHAPGELFDPAFRVWFQDTDLLARLRAAGCPPRCVEESRIRHGLSDTVQTTDPELRRWIDSQILRDREAFAAKHPGVVLRPVEFETAA